MQQRIINNYELMLDFFGMILKDRKTGEIARNPKNWEERYRNLNVSYHNYLRITRILKCLGLTGFEHFKIEFLKHFIIEIFQNHKLENATESLVTSLKYLFQQ